MGKVFKQPIIHKKGKFRAAQKKPAIKKDKLWKDTPVRPRSAPGWSAWTTQGPGKWQRNLPELLMAEQQEGHHNACGGQDFAEMEGQDVSPL